MQLLPPFTEGFGYGLDLRARPIPGRGVTCLRVSYNILLDPDMLINFIITSLFSPYPLLFVNGGTT